MKNNNNCKKPQIRFKGFDDAWEQRKLGDFGSVAMCKRVFKEQTSDKDAIPFYKIGTFGGIADAYISRALFEEYKLKYPYPNNGDILLSASGSIGRTIEYKGEEAYFQDSNIVWLNHNEAIDNAFLKYFYEVVNWHGIEGSTIKRLYNENILNTEIKLPSLPEQQKIGAFFSKLDNLITLHQREYEKLKNVKKSMLEKMFPKNNSKFPEIRFAGFNDAWEQRKLFELCDLFTDGNWIEAKDQSDEGIRLIQTGNVGINEFLNKVDRAKWISARTFETLKCTEVYPGDILISRLPEPAGRACIMPNIENKMITAVDCTIARISTNYCNEFVVQYLGTKEYFNKVNDYLAGGTRQRISRSNLANFDIPIPSSLLEQQKIGAFFSKLDNLITLHQRKFEKLKNIKKAMLEKMFPNNN